jgi:hypothetical protein
MLLRNSHAWKTSQEPNRSLADVIRLSGRWCFIRWMTSPTPYPEHRSILSVSPLMPVRRGRRLSSGLPLTATGNLSRAAVAEMRGLIEWPNYDQPNAFRLNKVINEPDFLSLHVPRAGSFSGPRAAGQVGGNVLGERC